jgi:hypothetical protein
VRSGLRAACGVVGTRLSHRQSKARRARDRTMIQPWRTDGPALTVHLSRPECNHFGGFRAPALSNSVLQSLLSARHGWRCRRLLDRIAGPIQRLFRLAAAPGRHNTILGVVCIPHIGREYAHKSASRRPQQGTSAVGSVNKDRMAGSSRSNDVLCAAVARHRPPRQYRQPGPQSGNGARPIMQAPVSCLLLWSYRQR